MAGKVAELEARLSDYLSVGLLSRLVPPSLVNETLTAHDRHNKRQQDLPAHAVVYYVTLGGIETTFTELKTTLKGADVVLRSKTPELVRQ